MREFWRKNRRSTARRRQSTTVLIILLLSIVLGCTQNKKVAQADTYICPMHPTVVSDKSGTCPVCGMELVLREKMGEEVVITDELNYLFRPVNTTVISSVKTINPTLNSMEVKTKLNGIITYDRRALTIISSRFNGRIEKLYVKYNFQSIRKGQKIMEIYSPDFLTAQRDL